MVDTQQLRLEFLDYLQTTFGEEFVELIPEPPGVQVGERVLYRFKGERTATRHELTSQELEDRHRTLVEIAKRTGLDESAVTTEPPISSGLPVPRLIDLPESHMMWDKDLRQWTASRALLPSPDYSLEWAVGVVFMSSEKLLLYLDFTHPKVKAVFRVIYDDEYDRPAGESAEIRTRFKQFCERAQELRAQYDGRTDVVWAKLVQLDNEPLCVRIREVT